MVGQRLSWTVLMVWALVLGTPGAEPTAVEYLRVEALVKTPQPNRVIERHEDDASCAVVAVMDPYLDLPAQLDAHSESAGPALVPLAPELVVGEGDDAGNHTLVRVLNRYGVAVAQFLAYPVEVRGGVSVNAGRLLGHETAIMAAPISDATTRAIRIFSRWGCLLGTIEPTSDVTAPFAVAVGDFVPNAAGDEIAVTSRQAPAQGRQVHIYDGKGKLLVYLPLPDGRAGGVTLSTRHDDGIDTVVAFLQAERKVCELHVGASEPKAHPLPFAPSDAAAFASVFPEERYWITTNQPEQSVATAVSIDGMPRDVDVGVRERLFWYSWPPLEGTAPFPEAKYVRPCGFPHIRTDLAMLSLSDTEMAQLTRTDPAYTKLEERMQQVADSYEREPPRTWEPCFTHRMHKSAFKAWADVVDRETGLPKYTALTRNNNTGEYGEFGGSQFYCATYAFDLPALDNLYILPLRECLRRLAVPFRNNPGHFVAVEPNHEHEIAIGADGTRGDYNPRMIQGFFHYLAGLYGESPADIGKAMAAPISEYFDAPRDWGRGDWDAYAAENAFFREWVAYNRYVVNRRLAQTFREALLAGFPPEAITCHQIPDAYAIGGMGAFSTVIHRYTPIDYALNTGLGYGFTRYGVWFRGSHNVLQGAYSSGFNMVTIGEYQALTPSVDDAFGQLAYIADHGGYAISCMRWPDDAFNATMDEALRRLIVRDEPRPGVTGGVGQVRAVDRDDAAYHIVCVGTGPDRNGLLKSVNQDGSWEGTVYVTPFHAHVDVTAVPVERRDPEEAWRIGPLVALDSGDQLDVAFSARSGQGSGSIRFSVLRDGVALPGLDAAVDVGGAMKSYRYVLRCRLPVDGVSLVMTCSGSDVTLTDLTAYREQEQTTKLTKQRLDGIRHRGAVTFDILGGQ